MDARSGAPTLDRSSTGAVLQGHNRSDGRNSPVTLKEALRKTTLLAADPEDDGGEPNPPTGDSDDGRPY